MKSAARSSLMSRIDEDDEAPKERVLPSPTALQSRALRKRYSPQKPVDMTRPPKQQYKEDKENETPRMRRDGSAEENAARRNNRRVSFTPPRTRTSLQQDTLQPKREEIIYEEEENVIEIVKQKSEGKLETKSSSILKNSPARPTMKRTDGQSELITSGKMYQPPTQLHDICNRAKTVNDLMEFLRSPHVRCRHRLDAKTTRV